MRLSAIVMVLCALLPGYCHADELTRVDSGFHPSINAPWIVNSDNESKGSISDTQVFLNFHPRPAEFFEQFDQGMCLGLVRTAAQLYETGHSPVDIAVDLITEDPASGLGYVVIGDPATPTTAYIDTRSELFRLIVEHQAGFQYGERINGITSALLTGASFLLGSHGKEVNRFFSAAEDVCTQIDAGHPWPVSIGSPDGMIGHAVLAYAYERTDDSIKLFVYDPNQLPSAYVNPAMGAPIDPDYVSITWTGLPEIQLTSGLGVHFVGQMLTPFEPDPLYDPAALELHELLGTTGESASLCDLAPARELR